MAKWRIVAAAAIVLLACEASVAAPPDGACAALTFHGAIAVPPYPDDALDVLVVLDDSPGMAGELPHARAELGRVLGMLATGDRNGDGVADQPPEIDMNVAIVTADLGAGGLATVAGCTPAGDGSALLGGPDCGAAPGPSRYCAPGDRPPAVDGAVRCRVPVTAGACPIAQPLDAALAALLPSASPLAFVGSTRPRGDVAPNAGFLRDDSMLLVVVVSNEDDCSSTDADIWSPGSATHVGPSALRCATYASSLTAIDRFVSTVRSRRPANPNLVAFAAITGVPPDLVATLPGSVMPDYARLFGDPRMVPHADATGTALAPACTSSRGTATPAPRLARAAQAFGENGTVRSICDDDWAAVLDVLIVKIGIVDGDSCLPRPIARDATGRVACDVELVLAPPSIRCGAPIRTCDDPALAGGVDLSTATTDADGRAHCQLVQLPVDDATRAGGLVPAGNGFFYDDYSMDATRACRVEGRPSGRALIAVRPPLTGGSELRIDCTEYVGSLHGDAGADAFCP